MGEYGTLAAYLVLPALLMVSQFYMQRMTTAATPPGGEKTGRDDEADDNDDDSDVRVFHVAGAGRTLIVLGDK